MLIPSSGMNATSLMLNAMLLARKSTAGKLPVSSWNTANAPMSSTACSAFGNPNRNSAACPAPCQRHARAVPYTRRFSGERYTPSSSPAPSADEIHVLHAAPAMPIRGNPHLPKIIA